jgi:glutathione S-transferase
LVALECDPNASGAKINIMQQHNLKLFVDSRLTSPYALSVFVTLMEKGMPFEMAKIDLNAHQNLTPPYCDHSLTARVPTLDHNGFYLSESSAIVEYLEEIFPAPQYLSVLPLNLTDRARARQIQAWIRSDLMPIREERSTELIYYPAPAAPLSDPAQRAVEKLIRIADQLIHSNSPYLFDDWCIADTDLALMLNRLVLNGDAVPDKLRQYAAGQWQRPSVQQWVKLDRSAILA